MKKLSHEEYLAFLLLYAAYADLEISRNEVELILDNIDKEVFVDMRRYFLSLNDKARLDIVLDQKDEYLTTQYQVDVTLEKIKELFKCDSKMLPIEYFYYNFLKRHLQS